MRRSRLLHNVEIKIAEARLAKKGTYRRIYVGFVRPLANILVRHIEFVRSLALSVVRQTRSICILRIILMSLCSNVLMS